ncbi:hypothetical protein BGAL_0591g00040 [Botrytis galanthina]|uniref:Uncharacterized protein n=1 Tax=Botrytis galanthina TaxID=278940 RepID=A0A4S8QNJ0_9HELO|nr:hypothetical protein BGAL_0591g00040 [Botrytis galanthina]
MMHQGALRSSTTVLQAKKIRVFWKVFSGGLLIVLVRDLPNRCTVELNPLSSKASQALYEQKQYCQASSPLRDLKHLDLETLWSTDLDSNVEEYH